MAGGGRWEILFLLPFQSSHPQRGQGKEPKERDFPDAGSMPNSSPATMLLNEAFVKPVKMPCPGPAVRSARMMPCL
jgi:hypothetical protein